MGVPWRAFEPFLPAVQTGKINDRHPSGGALGKLAESFAGGELWFLINEEQGDKGAIARTDVRNAQSGSNSVGFWSNNGPNGDGSSGSQGVGKTALGRTSVKPPFLAVAKRDDGQKKHRFDFANVPHRRASGKEKVMPIDEAPVVNLAQSEFDLDRDARGLPFSSPAFPVLWKEVGLFLRGHGTLFRKTRRTKSASNEVSAVKKRTVAQQNVTFWNAVRNLKKGYDARPIATPFEGRSAGSQALRAIDLGNFPNI